MSTTTELKPISEMTANEIADMMESGCVKMENVAPMYVRAIELLRRSAAHGESKADFHGDGLGLAMFMVIGPGQIPRIGRPGKDIIASLREWFTANADADIYVVRSWSDEVGCQNIENGRELLQMEGDELPSNAGEWTDEQKDILRRAAEILEHDFGRPHNAKELRALLSSAPEQAGSAESEREAQRKAYVEYLKNDDTLTNADKETALRLYDRDSALSAQGQQSEDARDAARYRALRRGQKWSVIDGIGDTLRADDLDAAIDAAMSTTPSEKEQK